MDQAEKKAQVEKGDPRGGSGFLRLAAGANRLNFKRPSLRKDVTKSGILPAKRSSICAPDIGCHREGRGSPSGTTARPPDKIPKMSKSSTTAIPCRRWRVSFSLN